MIMGFRGKPDGRGDLAPTTVRLNLRKSCMIMCESLWKQIGIDG